MTRLCQTRGAQQRHVLAPRLLAAAIAAGFVAGAAAETSPYYIGASQTFRHESNMLGLADGQATPAGYSKADRISSTALLAGFDQPFGRQRAYANLSVRSNRYSDNSIFNNVSYNGSAGLNWSTLERLSGTVTAATTRSLQRFNFDEIGFLGEKNLETVQSINATANLGVMTQYSFELGGGHREVTNSLQRPAVQARNFEQDSGSAGLRWRPSSATSAALSLGAAKGSYPKFRTLPSGEYEADRFKRTDITLSANYEPSGASSLSGRITSGKTNYDLNEQRNFSGITGSVEWAWRPTGKTRVSTVLSRDTGQDSYSTSLAGFLATADYSRVTNALRVQADHAFSAKIAFVAALSYYDRDIVRTTDNIFGGRQDARGEERTKVLSIGVRWAPLRAVSVGCDINNDARAGSGQLTSDLHNRGFGCYGQLTLQ